MKFRNSLYALAIAGVALFIPNTTQAGLTFEIQEVGTDVVLSYVTGGSLNLAGLGSASVLGPLTGMLMRTSALFAAGSSTYDVYASLSVTGPSNFGSGSPLYASSSSGPFIGFGYLSSNNSQIVLPVGYNGGTINTASSSTFASINLSSLGLTAGQSYVWTLANTDTITLNVLGASPVPEASGSVAGLGLAMAGLYQLRRRRQNTVTE